jgi:protein TonB
VARLRLVVALGRGTASPLRPWVVGSLVVHGAVAVLVTAWPGWRLGPAIPPDSLMVELVAALPGPPATPTRSVSPASETEPAETTPPELTASEPAPEPPKRLPERRKPEPKPVKKPPPPKRETAPAPPDEETPREGAGGADGESSGSAAAGGSVSAMAGGDASFGWYRTSVTNALFLRWRRPVLTDLREPVEVQVDFDIRRSGEVGEVRIARSSGIPSLDRSALRAVAEASPLPPLPPAWRSEILPASFVFRLYPEGN